MKKVITVLAVVATCVLGYMCFQSVAIPENFKKTQAKREAVIQERLKQIARVQEFYSVVHGKYANAAELEEFLNTGKVYNVVSEGDYTDEMREKGISEREAASKGLIKRDTIWTDASATLLPQGMTAKQMLEVPGFPGQKIEVETATIPQEIGNDVINVPVFRAAVPMSIYLGDLDEKIRESKIYDAKQRYEGKGYPGLAIGSLEEVKNTGNWE